MATRFILTTIKAHFHKMLSEFTVNFWKFVKSGNGSSVQNLKTLLWIRGIHVELCHFHKCYVIFLKCLKKKLHGNTPIEIPVSNKHGLPRWKIKSCAEAAKYLHLQRTKAINTREQLHTAERQSVQSLIFSTVWLRLNPFHHISLTQEGLC